MLKREFFLDHLRHDVGREIGVVNADIIFEGYFAGLADEAMVAILSHKALI